MITLVWISFLMIIFLQYVISNEPLYTTHFNSVFEELWKNGIDAEDRIRDIEVGAEWADVEVIPMSSRAKETTRSSRSRSISFSIFSCIKQGS
jgi:hypothetical protein